MTTFTIPFKLTKVLGDQPLQHYTLLRKVLQRREECKCFHCMWCLNRFWIFLAVCMHEKLRIFLKSIIYRKCQWVMNKFRFKIFSKSSLYLILLWSFNSMSKVALKLHSLQETFFMEAGLFCLMDIWRFQTVLVLAE